MTQPQKSSMFPIGEHWPRMYGRLEDECPCPIQTSASEDYWPKKLSSHLLTTSWWLVVALLCNSPLDTLNLNTKISSFQGQNTSALAISVVGFLLKVNFHVQ